MPQGCAGTQHTGVTVLHILTVNQNKDRDMELWTLAKLHKAVLERDQAGLQGYASHVLHPKPLLRKDPCTCNS